MNISLQRGLRALAAIVLAAAVALSLWAVMDASPAFQAVEARLAQPLPADADYLTQEQRAFDETLQNRRIAFAVLSGACALALVWLLTAPAPRLHLAGLAMMLLCGGAMIAACPFDIGASWDDHTHLWLMNPLVKLYKGDLASFTSVFSTWYFGYWPNAIGLAAADMLGRTDLSLLLGRISSLMVYAGICTTAIRIAPKYKLTFLMVSCMPVTLFLAVNYTYDAVLISFLLLGIAMILRELCLPRTSISPNRMVGMTAIICLGTLSKPVYTPLLLLMWMFPREKFSSRRLFHITRIMTAVVMLSTIATMLLPGTYDNVIGGDDRFPGTDSAAQLAHILQDPLGFLNVMGSFFLRNGASLFTTILSSFAYLGNPFDIGLALALGLVLLSPWHTAGEPEIAPLTWKRRVWMLLLTWGPLVALAASQYLVSTEVGSTDITGMQPRYTLPVLALFALVLMLPESWRQKARMFSRPAALLMCCALAAVTLHLCWSLALQPLAAGMLSMGR